MRKRVFEKKCAFSFKLGVGERPVLPEAPDVSADAFDLRGAGGDDREAGEGAAVHHGIWLALLLPYLAGILNFRWS